MLTINGIDELKGKVGEELGVSDWHDVTQDAINAFADATGDHQWIHVDPERAAETPVRRHDRARPLHALARPEVLLRDVRASTASPSALNYGYGKVRFPAPLPVGSKVRMRATLTAVDDVPGGVQVTVTQTFEREGQDKPVCVAESLARFYTGG